MTTRGKDGRAALLERAIRLKRSGDASAGSKITPRPADLPARLGEMQRSLWLLHRLDPKSAAYHLASAFRAPPGLSSSALQSSLNHVVSRHRILRSTFHRKADAALQVAHPDSELALERFTAASGELENVAIREARRPFDLEMGPLVRLLLIEEPSASNGLLVLVLHHILADEWSLGILWKELAAGYEVACEQPRPAGAPEAPPALQYDDYVHWLSTRPDRERETSLAYWKRRLETLPEDLALPFESPAASAHRRDAAGRPSGKLLRRVLDSDTHGQISGLAAATETTPFAVLAFAFRLLLHRYLGERRPAFGTPASTRGHPATADMIGYFLNPIVIDVAIDEEQTVEESLRRFAGEVRDRLAHASVPFDLLVEELAPTRRPGRHPIFQAMFVYQETPPPPVLAGVRLEPISLDLGESKFDLTLFASAGATSFEIAVEYRVDRFQQVSMERLLGHYQTLIRHLSTHRERATAELPILEPDEARKIRRFEQGAPPIEAIPAHLPRAILERAKRSPGSLSVRSSRAQWSYADLERAGSAIAEELLRAGVAPGDRVGLFLGRSPWMIAGILGSHWAGAAYVPLDPAYPAARNRSVLDDAEVAAVLTRSALSPSVPEVAALMLEVDALEPLSERDPTTVAASQKPPLALDLPGELPAYLLYTSGSTGSAKGVVVTQDNLAASTAARSQIYDEPPGRFLLLPSVAFDSSVAGIFWTLAEGETLVLPTESEVKDPRLLARLIGDEGVTSLLCVPSLYAHLLRAGTERLGTLATVIVAGEICPPQLAAEHFRTLPKTRLFNEYGPTEATVWASVHELDPQDPRRAIPIGRPIPGTRIEVLDERGRRQPVGVPGEGWIYGPTVASGYWRRRDLTEQRFVSGESATEGLERGFRSGDRLSWTAEGRLLFHGRIDDQIKLRGFRIEPGEIEARLLEFPAIKEAAVVVRHSERLVAFIVTAGTAAAGALREHLARQLPEHMIPARFVELEELPHLPNGKLDRARLQGMALELPAPAEPATQILDDRQQTLVSLWQSLLGRSGIGLDDNFFQLGGHSLSVVEMTVAIERDLGIELAPAEVFQNPTVRELAARIELERGSNAPAFCHLFPIEPGGRKSPFIFCIPHFFSGMVATRFRGERPVYGLRGVGLRPEGNRGRWRTMQDLGRELAEEVLRRFPDQACIIAGYSFGGTMAVELARQLEARGVPIERLYLVSPMPLDFYRFGPFRVQLDGLRQPVAELSPGQAFGRFLRDNNPLTRRPYRHAWRQVVVEPWRRILCSVGKLRRIGGLPLTPRILHADVRLERFRLHARYRPGIVRSPTVVFNAREPDTDAAATWRRHFEGPFTVHEIPDPHLGADSIRAAKTIILEHLEGIDS